MDLYEQIQQKIKELEISIKSLRKTGTAFAEAERDYKVKLAEEALRLRDSGMAVGMIDKVCYGLQSVSTLRFKRDVADAVYKANLEAINSLKLQLRLLDAQLSREWGANLSD